MSYCQLQKLFHLMCTQYNVAKFEKSKVKRSVNLIHEKLEIIKL